jgi:hypothetical protein
VYPRWLREARYIILKQKLWSPYVRRYVFM